jgi:hypothetical protein
MTTIPLIQSKKLDYDEILLTTVKAFYNNRKCGGALSDEFPPFCFDLKRSFTELAKLGTKDRCIYDRPTIGFAYAFRWHRIRFNQWIKCVDDFLNTLGKSRDLKDQTICVYDIGAGTGAVMLAWAIVLWARDQLKQPTPKVQYYNFDDSAFMIEFNKLLWIEFTKMFYCKVDAFWPHTTEQIKDSSCECTRVMCLSYFFDIDDKNDLAKEESNMAEIKNAFKPDWMLTINSHGKHRNIASKIFIPVAPTPCDVDYVLDDLDHRDDKVQRFLNTIINNCGLGGDVDNLKIKTYRTEFRDWTKTNDNNSSNIPQLIISKK